MAAAEPDGPLRLSPLVFDPADRAIDDAAGPAIVPTITRATVADAQAILQLQLEAYQSEGGARFRFAARATGISRAACA